jgi:hypothetical protein
MLELTANVWSDVVLDACNVFIVQRSVVGDLDIAPGDLFFELYMVSKSDQKVQKSTYACDLVAEFSIFG